ncbi:MAG: AMP-binding protein [Gemmatimonadetes bacterium]|nr:AMP-binding protein [Gemmatimonadota bacterium]
MLRGGSSFTLVTREGELGGRELEGRVGSRMEELRRNGLRRGSLCPLLSTANVEGVLDLLACWRLEAVPAPINPLLPAREMEAARTHLGAVPENSGQDPGPSRWPGGPPVAMVRTSGTSGIPRYLSLSRRNVTASVKAGSERLGLTSSDTWLASLSPAHVGGLMVVARAWLLGCRLAVTGSSAAPSVSEIGRALDGDPGPVTHLSLVPTQLSRLLDLSGGDPPSALRLVLVGGARTPGALVDRCIERGWPIALTYGMTETTSQAATATPEEVRRKPGAVGRPIAGVEIAISPGGEILVKGDVLAARTDAGGWFRTGDLGRLDEDGDLWITGRRSDRIISGGATIEAGDVENVLAEHPAVAEACVIGLPDELWGDKVCACVVPVEGEFDLAELDEWTRTRLAPSHRPRLWHLRASLPLNAGGKVDRSVLAREMRPG